MTPMDRQSPQVRAFLDAITAVCRKHGLALGHEDFQGGFEVRPYAEDLIVWLNAAADRTGPDQEPYPWQQ